MVVIKVRLSRFVAILTRRSLAGMIHNYLFIELYTVILIINKEDGIRGMNYFKKLFHDSTIS